MKNSTERIAYITEYITSYESKIKAANKNGLFDNAKLFELFAIEICNLWFDQKFHNLNDEVLNYPGVDLLSEKNDIFIQVSTAQNIPSKIKTTLEKVKENKSKNLSNIQEVYFLVINNNTIDNVKDYSGKDRIGSIDFESKKHLITTQQIITHATSDLDFQMALYDLLIKEDTNLREVTERLFSEIKISKTVGLTKIDSLINDEYEIDKSDIVNRIKSSESQFVSVRGEAGSGKSVICKKVVEDEPYLLFARAERFLEETDINNIWHLNIEYALRRFKDKSICFFIDSLEFIADAPNTKLDLLQTLYEISKKYPNSKIITSCRSCDATKFFKIDSKYSIESHIVEELTVDEINKIAKSYPVIKTFMSDNVYLDLVKSPFYINIIVKNVTDNSNIKDENKLRDFIWENVICIKEKTSQYRLCFNDISNEVRKIVFNRAMSFSVGVEKEEVNSSILHALTSEGVVIKNGNTIRLKYDIFEDICFEKEIDKKFDSCKGDFKIFFSQIEAFGRCSFRRYQIWISNKILSKVNREKFLYKLIFTKDLPQKWVKQTEIGLVKSKFCTPFFEEQYNNILSEGRLNEFVNITNLYAFEAKVLYFNKMPLIYLVPKGNGRSSLIKIIYDNNLFTNSNLDSNSIKKLCSDYSKEPTYDCKTATMACSILQHYIESELEIDKKYYYSVSKIINPLLNPIYQMSEYSYEWILSFWERQKECFVSGDHDLQRLAEEIIEYTLKNTTINLAKNLPKELCDLADVFWTSDLNHSHMFYGSRYDSKCYDYGLNKHADSYDHSLNSIKDFHFFTNLLDQNFWIGFRWTIDFINKSINNLVGNENINIEKISLKFVMKNETKNYYANSSMWFAGTQEYKVPAVISDIVYHLKNKIIRLLKSAIEHNVNYVDFANNIKNQIFQNSNSIIMFSIIEDVGIQFENELPGYALDLATSMDIIYWDISRFAALNPCAEIRELRRNILTTVGLPYLKERYTDNTEMKFNLQDYVLRMQYINTTKDYCHKILDYLYSIYPNNKNTARENLQIQKMDMRNLEMERIDDNIVAISATITGEAKTIVDNNEKNNASKINIEKAIKDFFETLDPNNYKSDDVVKTINYVLSEIFNLDIPFVYQNHLVTLIALALNKTELDTNTRDEYCDFWIDGVEIIVNNGSFSFEYNYLFLLLKQINSNASKKTIYRIKNLIINLVTYNGDNGIVHNLRNITREFLKSSPQLSKAVFNTVVMLSKDELEHQLFNNQHICSDDDDIEFFSNQIPKIKEHDYSMLQNSKDCYCSHKDEIIEKYLYNEDELNLSSFSIFEYDINMLCNIVNCGCTLKNDVFAHVLRETVRYIITKWNSTNEQYKRNDIVSINCSMELSKFMGKELLENFDSVIDILFSNIDFTSFSDKSIEFYQRVFGVLLPIYVDAFNEPNIRCKCKSILLGLEEIINDVKCDDYVRNKLYRSLILSVNGYEGDWSKVQMDYSYADIQFLNRMFSSYGKYNFKYFMYTLNQMKLEKLLPYVLPSIDKTIEAFATEEFFDNSDYEKVKFILNKLIVLCFINFNEKIKQDEELIKAYEGILETLILFNSEEAAVLLDEFRIH